MTNLTTAGMVETVEQPPASAAGYLQYTILPSLWQVALRARHLTHRAGRAIFLPRRGTDEPFTGKRTGPARGRYRSDCRLPEGAGASVQERWRLLVQAKGRRTRRPRDLSPPAKPHRCGLLRRPPNAAPDRLAAGVGQIAIRRRARRHLRTAIAVRMFKSLSVLRLDTAHLQQYSINYGKFSAAGSPGGALCVLYHSRHLGGSGTNGLQKSPYLSGKAADAARADVGIGPYEAGQYKLPFATIAPFAKGCCAPLRRRRDADLSPGRIWERNLS